MDPTPRQEMILDRVVEGYVLRGAPVGSKWLSHQRGVRSGSSTIRSELAALEECGLLAHPHTSAGRIPTQAGYKRYAQRIIAHQGSAPARASLGLELDTMRREVEAAMRATTQALSEVTNLLAVVSAPSVDVATIRRIEVLLLQPHVVMVVTITSTGGVAKRMFTFQEAVDPGLAGWASSYLNERLSGLSPGAFTLAGRLDDPALSDPEREFIDTLASAFSRLGDSADEVLYVDGAGRLIDDDRFRSVVEINQVMDLLEGRYRVLEVLSSALDERRVYVRVGRDTEIPELESVSIVAANYGLAHRNLGTVGVIGPLRMDYRTAIAGVQEAACVLSAWVEEVYCS